MDTVANGEPAVKRLETQLFNLADVFRKHQEYIKTKYKISSLEMEIIQLIVNQGKKKMKEIGQHFNIKLSTLTSIIDKIERQKLVKRVNSKDDRRVVFLEVTKKGQTLHMNYSKYIQSVASDLENVMDQGAFMSFVEGLEKMSDLVKAGEGA
ncbi:MAG: MarR family transcriptional regulator [Bacteroidota bacterium]